MAKAAQSSFVRQVMRGLPKDWPSTILEKVRLVSVEEIKQAMLDTVLPIFSPETSNLFVTCAPIMEEKLVAGFGEIGFKADVKPLAWFQDDYGLKDGEGQGDEGEEEGEEEDEDEEDDDMEDEDDEEDDE